MSDSLIAEQPESLADDLALEPIPVQAPVAPAERIQSIDVLRGFALCGILAMNVVMFFWPYQVYEDPTLGGGFTGINKIIWIINHIVFDTKMMSIFSMLFGAGLVLKFTKAEKEGKKVAGVYYRRILILLGIGLVHAYLIWEGDILVLYAQCGLLLFLFRKKTPTTLIVLGTVFILMLIPMGLGFGAWIRSCNAAVPRVEQKVAAGEKLDEFETFIHKTWPELKKEMAPDRQTLEQEVAKKIQIYRRGYWDVVKERAKTLIWIQTFGLIAFLWMALGRMLLGMGLMKLGVFEAKRSNGFYWWMLALGYGIGLPLVIADTIRVIQANFSNDYVLSAGQVLFGLSSLPMALGHVAAIMLICKSGFLENIRARFAAVGRMALTNYLMHGIVGTTLGCGYGFGLFGRVERWQMALFVVAVWIFQLFYSPIWLRYFRFGPAEWLWRTLTYMRPQPMRIQQSPALD